MTKKSCFPFEYSPVTLSSPDFAPNLRVCVVQCWCASSHFDFKHVMMRQLVDSKNKEPSLNKGTFDHMVCREVIHQCSEQRSFEFVAAAFFRDDTMGWNQVRHGIDI